ncbi:HhH-GPD superfamily base excision DNA repair protein [Ordospora pajunii]|uniref:HhH-GPD superfamily base excision DNA repair protein n=1 Tax=Ordospora pajunii TaxID=3039483 RepID=UPI0029526467|nr:HhH-GPD superfamily base excision DNA repair protein [Ordospora pajunii]KAH9411025.1 HhH-GPD superfamily base excision DNA repair protein [Ordospora pajunii]
MHDSVQLYNEIKHHRKSIVAPVDLMGCSVTPRCTSYEQKALYVLIALLLSSQTRDGITWNAMQRLCQSLPEGTQNNCSEYNGLTLENILITSTRHINDCIKKVGFHNKKALYIKKIAQILSKTGLPSTLDDLLILPGIGVKMGVLYMAHVHNKTVGISVDTHVHRISNRIGLVNTKRSVDTQARLQEIIPTDEWIALNTAMVGFGQTICLPRNPDCSKCIIASKCPSSLF